MRRASTLALLVSFGTATACDVDEPTAPAPEAPRPAAEVVTASLATVLGRTHVDEPGDVGLHTSLVSGSDGAQRVAYYDATNERLKYAACFSNCTSAANWQRGVIDPSARVGWFASLKVRSGVRHVVYYDAANQNLKYARCATDCLLQGSWAKGTVASAGSVGQSASLAIDAQSGRLYVSYVDQTNSDLKYATCLSDCTVAANWQRATVDPSGVTVTGMVRTSIAVGPAGRRHVSYSASGKLKYATCLASCADPANWERVAVDEASDAGYFSALAVDANGVRHVSYHDAGNSDLKYARCASNCSNPSGWARVAADESSFLGYYTSLAVGADGKVHVSYHVSVAGRLKYASCAGSCLQATSWSRQTVDGGCRAIDGVCTEVGQFTSLKLGGGKVHISYFDVTHDNLKYAELTP